MEKGSIENNDSEVYQAITEFLNEKLHIPETVLNENNWDEPLTGNVFRLSGVDLIYILFELEKHFEIQINPEHLSNYGFGTIRKIGETITRYTNTN